MDLQDLGGNYKREVQGFAHLAVGTEGMRCQWAIPPQWAIPTLSCPPGNFPTQRHAPICQRDCQSP